MTTKKFRCFYSKYLQVCLSVTSVVEERLCQESLTLEEGALLAQVLFLMTSYYVKPGL